jgi:hypothetical protein
VRFFTWLLVLFLSFKFLFFTDGRGEAVYGGENEGGGDDRCKISGGV